MKSDNDLISASLGGVEKSHSWYKPRGGGDFLVQALNRTKIKGECEE